MECLPLSDWVRVTVMVMWSHWSSFFPESLKQSSTLKFHHTGWDGWSLRASHTHTHIAHRHPCQFKTHGGYEKSKNQGQQNPHNVTRQNDVPFIAVAHVIPPSACSLATTPQTNSDAEISQKACRCDSTNDSGEAEWEELSQCMTALSQSRPSWSSERAGTDKSDTT